MVASDGAGLSFPSHHQRFTVTTFALLDPGSQRALRGQVRSASEFLLPKCSMG